MNGLKRSIASKLSPFSHPSIKWRSLLYSTTYTLKPPSPPKRSQTTTASSSSSKAEAVKLSDWPRPSEIPYQAKVANFVNLIGHIRAPVKFWTSPDGKYRASTVIFQDNSHSKSCLIPIVFEGDLAHIATFHLKENDYVYVNGRLSEEPLPFLLSEITGKLHLQVQNINFVQGFEKQKSGKKFGENVSSESDGIVMDSKPEEEWENSVMESTFAHGAEKHRTITGSVGNEKGKDPVIDPWRDLVLNSTAWLDYRKQKSIGLVSNKYPDFKRKDNAAALWLGSDPGWVLGGLEDLKFDVLPSTKNKTKDAKEFLWRSLVENPKDWWDNRLDKENPKAPDFKHKTNGEVLWLGSAPGWVMGGLESLEFDVPPSRPNKAKDAKEFLWRSLVENPKDWWDNRLDKKNPKAPDFRHKTSGEVLWLGKCTPEWILSKLQLAGEKQKVV